MNRLMARHPESPQRELPTSAKEQCDLERQLGELSRSLLALDLADIDRAVHESVATIGRMAIGDRCALMVVADRGPEMSAVYEWRRDGIEGAGPSTDPDVFSRFRWMGRRLVHGEALHVPAVRELPDEAEPERTDLGERGVLSCLAVPVHSRETIVGYLIVECVRGPRRWSAREITLLSLAAEITAGAIERARAERLLADQLLVEKRIADLSRRLLTGNPHEADAAIESALAEVADWVGADRVYLLSFVENAEEFDVYEWCGKGVAPTVPRALPWATRQVMAGNTLNIPTLDSLPAEAHAERQRLEARGVVSMLGIPVFSSPGIIGFLGFESMSQPRRWREQEITLLRLVGELLMSSLRRKCTEDALRSSQAQLLHSQKMEAVGRLAGGIAHDFNNLLTVILGFGKALLDDLDDDHWIREDVQEIYGAAERAAALTRQLLTFSRREPSEARAVDLNATVSGLEEMLQRLLGEDVELLIHTDDAGESGCCFVECDPHHLEQVLINLAVNARDAMPDGGRLELTSGIRRVDAALRARLGLARTGDYVTLSIADTGCGMDGETRLRIFEPFFTTKDPGKGTGLGLSIVYSVVERCGGAIEVRGGPAKGTVFEIYLPRLAREAATDAAVPAEDHAGGHETILLVEDEHAVRRLARRILERQGYRIVEARDGVEALEMAALIPETIDLLLSDVVMPRMNGGELARRLRQQRPDVRVLLVSGYPRPRDGAGDDSPLRNESFLYKPFSAQALLARVRELLGDAKPAAGERRSG